MLTTRSICKRFGEIALVCALLHGAAAAQDVDEARIIKALTPPPKPEPSAKTTDRSLSLGLPATKPPGSAAGDVAFIQTLRGKSGRVVSISEREKLDAIAADKPQINLTMEFASNSDQLRGAALANANNLGKALTSPELKGQTFMIAGHTDAKGSDAANQKLSERRASAVTQYLVRTFGIPASNLITVGYGKMRLKNPNDQEGRENRRVQVVNLLEVKVAAH